MVNFFPKFKLKLHHRLYLLLKSMFIAVILLIVSLFYDVLSVFAFIAPSMIELANQYANEEQAGIGCKKFTAVVLFFFCHFVSSDLSFRNLFFYKTTFQSRTSGIRFLQGVPNELVLTGRTLYKYGRRTDIVHDITMRNVMLRIYAMNLPRLGFNRVWKFWTLDRGLKFYRRNPRFQFKKFENDNVCKSQSSKNSNFLTEQAKTLRKLKLQSNWNFRKSKTLNAVMYNLKKFEDLGFKFEIFEAHGRRSNFTVSNTPCADSFKQVQRVLQTSVKALQINFFLSQIFPSPHCGTYGTIVPLFIYWNSWDKPWTAEWFIKKPESVR